MHWPCSMRASRVRYFNETILMGSMGMRSFVIR